MDSWFSIFGEGEVYVQAILNSILAVLASIGVFYFVFKWVTNGIRAKTIEDPEAKKILRNDNIKNIGALAILLLVSTIVFIVINIIPAPSNTIDSTWFVVFGEENAADAQLYFNIALSVLIAIALLVYLIIAPMRLIQYIGADAENKVDIRKSLISSTVWLLSTIVILFVANVVINIVPAPI